MTSQQRDEEAVFHIARQIPNVDVRSGYLDQVCAADRGLRERVEALLGVYAQEQEFLKSQPEPATTTDQYPISEGPGDQIGRYRLLQKIGEGGFGVVYMAEQQRPVRRKVALKIIKPGMDTHAVVARFEAERQALALMEHPNISRVLDGGATETGRPYFVMELVRGIPISEYCDKNQLSTHDRLRLFVTVCQQGARNNPCRLVREHQFKFFGRSLVVNVETRVCQKQRVEIMIRGACLDLVEVLDEYRPRIPVTVPDVRR
ncbi:MAG: serine/threonine protein kinase [Planctomycetota bacterium]|jgi:hypothetical protein